MSWKDNLKNMLNINYLLHRKFFHFLNDNNCYDHYVKMTKSHNEYALNIPLKDYLIHLDKLCQEHGFSHGFMYLRTFPWEEDEKGYEFWRILNKRWLLHL